MTATTRAAALPFRRFLGWRIALLATIAGAMTAPGQTIGVAVFVDPMISELGLTRSALSFAYLIGTLIGAVALLPVGRWIDRFGARRAMTVIGLAFGGGLVAMAGVQGFITLILGFTFIRWLGQGSLGLVSTLAITPWFERRRGAVFGISLTGVQAGLAVAPILLGLLVVSIGWRESWIIAAIAVWVIVVPIAWFGIIDRPSDVGQRPDGDAIPDASADDVDAEAVPDPTRDAHAGEAYREPRFWLMNLAIAAMSMLGTGLNFHQISILGANGLTATEAAALFLPQIAGVVVAGIVVGGLADRIAARWLLALGMALLALALAMVTVISPGWPVILYAVVLGSAAGTLRPLVATILPRWYGLAHIGAIQGTSAFIGVAASAAGPVALALANDSVTDWATASLVFVAAPVLIGLGALTISERPGSRLARY